MEEELQKRNTDCVYFLASPLTCKKGIDCEYRHNETARLNPRDCWYWMAGSCLNPICAFRHPPLDGHPETASESALSHQQSAAPGNKTNLLCYFYFNGFCNRGERCCYLHGPDETVHTWKSSKKVSAAVDGLSLEKMTMFNHSGPVPVEKQLFEAVPERAAGVKIKPTQELHHTISNNVADRSASPCEEIAAIRSSSPIPEEAFVQSRFQESAGQSLNDQQLDPIRREEWLESSPGFDVLVNDRSEDFDYKDNVEYDPAYPDLRTSFGQEVHTSFHHVDDEDIRHTISKFQLYETERIQDHILLRRRTVCEAELGARGCCGVDLRDYLKKRRLINAEYPAYSQIRERPRKVSSGHVHGKLPSKVEVYSVGSHIQNKTCLKDIYEPARSRHSRVSRSRHQFKQKRPYERRNLLSEVSEKIASRKQRSAQESTLFKGPKSLAQIKEEKRKAQENGIAPIEQGPR